jgi:hypothetical protein
MAVWNGKVVPVPRIKSPQYSSVAEWAPEPVGRRGEEKNLTLPRLELRPPLPSNS